MLSFELTFALLCSMPRWPRVCELMGVENAEKREEVVFNLGLQTGHTGSLLSGA